MALIDEDKLQGNVKNILELIRKQAACCDDVATGGFATSSIAGPVYFTVSRGGKVKVYNQPGGTLITNYGTLTHI
jgi:hypothetical protein